MILLTDGENTTGKISPLTAAEIAASDSVGIKIYTIGVGTKGMALSPVNIHYFTGKFKQDLSYQNRFLRYIADKN